MSKFLTKSVKKVTLLSVILAIILAAAIVVGTLFGFNTEATVKSNQTVTISTYKHNEAYLDDIKSDCEDIFEDKILYEIDGTVLYEDIIEHVYVFSADADLEETVAEIKAHFEARKNDANDELAINDVVVNITLHKESNVSYLAKNYVSRAIIASVIFAILAFVYVTLRFRRWDMGLLVALAVVLGIGFTTAIIALVTASTVYAIAIAGLLSTITAIMTLHRVRLASKEEDAKNQSAAEIVANSIAWKEILSLCAILAVATLLTGILVGKAGIWFAVSSLVGIIMAAFIGILYVPAVCIPLKGAVDAKIANKTVRYKGAEKTSTKTKKAAKKEVAEEAPVAAAEEAANVAAPVEEATEEVVEEVPVEETVEETVEEAAAEETEEENND